MSSGALGNVAALTRWVSLPALGAVIIWGAMVAFTKYAFNDFNALSFIALRCAVSALVLFGFQAMLGGALGMARADWRRLLIAGVAGQGFFSLFTLVGLQHTTATHNILLFSTTPIVGAIAFWLLRRHSPGRLTWLGIFIGFVGVALLVGPGASAPGASLYGDTLTLIGTLGWVTLTSLPRPLTAKYGAISVNAWLNLIAFFVLLPIAIGPISATWFNPPSLNSWLAFFYSAIFGTVVAYTLWQQSAHQIGAARTLVYGYLEPLITILIAVWLLNETFDGVQAIGAVVLMAGVILAEHASANGK